MSTIPGITITNELLSKVQSTANDCDPSIQIETEKIGSNVLRVIVQEGVAKPYRCTNGFYMRNGANAQKMSTNSIIEFIEKEGRVRFDEVVRKDIDFNTCFSSAKWTAFAQLSKIDSQNPEFTLKSLGAVKEMDGENYFTNAGVLLFTDDPTSFLPQATVSCVLYKGIEKVTIIDRKEFGSDLISNINSCMQFFERHINIGAKIDGLQRTDVWEIPVVAMREAIVNALVHRDYLEKGARVTIEIFDDRICISNPGGLPKGLEANDFGKYSLTRNATLASLLLRTSYFEKLGTGINRINRALKEAKLPKASFEFNHFFSVTFSRIKGGQKGGQKGKLKASIQGKTTVRAKLTYRQDEVLQLIIKNPSITRDELAVSLDINTSAIQKHIEKLKERGAIERVGGDRGGYWKVNE